MNSQTLFITYYAFLSVAVLPRLSTRPRRQTSERRTGLWPKKIGLRSLKTRIVLLQTLTAGSGITATPWRVCSEELTYKERSIYIQDDFTEQLMVEDFIDTVRNEKLAYGLRRLTDRQRYAIELAFWEGYQYKEIAVILDCSPAAITLLLQRAFHRLRSFLAE